MQNLKTCLLILLTSCTMADEPHDASGTTRAGFVVSQLSWPRDYLDYAFDVDGDGYPENHLGNIAFELTRFANVQSLEDRKIARGELILLADLQPSDAISAGDATFTLYAGRNPKPAPCPPDPACGEHLLGTATIEVADAPRLAPLRGSIVQRTFTSTRGDLPLVFSIMGSSPIAVTLRDAQVEIQAGSLGGFGGRLGGAILESEIDAKVYPAIQQGLSALVARDCSPQSCTCTGGSSAESIILRLDTTPKDCSISIAEIKSSYLALQPDVGVNGQRAVSIGLGVTAVDAVLRF